MKIILDFRRLFGRTPAPPPEPPVEEAPTPAPEPAPEPRRLLITGQDAVEIGGLMDNYQGRPIHQDTQAKIQLWQAINRIHPETLDGKWTITVKRSYLVLEEVL